ncbi:hypothetical protein SDC9_56533 [bioreactor metagenome]|uniref:Uncharacterized protein n=1 Tax=bioreactor metagenome TaxID=1076179 RepID=A0A644X261_9ZZZZ
MGYSGIYGKRMTLQSYRKRFVLGHESAAVSNIIQKRDGLPVCHRRQRICQGGIGIARTFDLTDIMISVRCRIGYVADSIAIGVCLVGVRNIRGIVRHIRDSIVIIIWVRHIADAIPVGILLSGICDIRRVVGYVADPVPVGILLSGVCDIGSVVRHIRDPVFVRVGEHRICRQRRYHK